jgi:hypothetical protein
MFNLLILVIKIMFTVKVRKSLLVLGLVFVSVGSVLCQEVRLDGEIRSRGEYRDGFQSPLAESESGTYVNNLRTRLNLGYKGDDIRAGLSILDSRTFGGTAIARTGNGLGLLEAWGEYRFGNGFSFTLGRQGLEYDDKRLFSYNNWSNTPGAHDLLLVKYVGDGFSVHVGSAYNHTGDSLKKTVTPYTLDYKTLNFIWASRSFGKVLASAVWINDGFERKTDTGLDGFSRNTVGLNVGLNDKKSPTTFAVSGYYQFGRDKSFKSLHAYLLAGKVQQRLSSDWSVQVGGDLFSGSSPDIKSGESGVFNKLYGSNHAFNGSIEYWRTLPAQGLRDLYGGLTFKRGRLGVNVTYHSFGTQKEFAAGQSKGLGSEVDLTVDYSVNSRLALQGGWSTYFVSDGTKTLKKLSEIDTGFPQWGYIQVSFKPVFGK